MNCSGHANGNTRDRQGRLLTCEHGGVGKSQASSSPSTHQRGNCIPREISIMFEYGFWNLISRNLRTASVNHAISDVDFFISSSNDPMPCISMNLFRLLLSIYSFDGSQTVLPPNVNFSIWHHIRLKSSKTLTDTQYYILEPISVKYNYRKSLQWKIVSITI